VPGRAPAIGDEVEAAAGDDAVDVGVKAQVASPGVQNEGEAERGAETFGVAPEGEQGVGRGGEEEIEDLPPVGERERPQERGESEDEVEAVGVEHAAPTLFDPAVLSRPLAGGAVAIEAGVVEHDLGGAGGAAIEMAAKGVGATAFDVAHRSALFGPKHVTMAKALAVSAEDVGDIESGRTGSGVREHAILFRVQELRLLAGDGVERGAGGGNDPGADVDVARGGAHAGVSEQHLDHAQVGAVLEQMRGEGVP